MNFTKAGFPSSITIDAASNIKKHAPSNENVPLMESANISNIKNSYIAHKTISDEINFHRICFEGKAEAHVDQQEF